MTSPKVSVVLTTYNRTAVLSETIEMILEQTFEDFELLVCDDHSTDDTSDVVEAWTQRDPRITYFRQPMNIGMPGNLNFGICQATGRYIANLHDGDVYSPHLLERWSAALDGCPEALFVFNAYASIDSTGVTTRLHSEHLGPCSSGDKLLDLFYRRTFFSSPVWGTVMARREAYLAVGLFDERFGFYSDIDMWLRLADQGHVAYIDAPLISLVAVPRTWSYPLRKERRLIHQMLLESRIRQLPKRFPRGAFEVLRHIGQCVVDDSWSYLLLLRRTILRMLGLRPTRSI
jgi:glycosyltransferase involved in cell wall biosynthesis